MQMNFKSVYFSKCIVRQSKNNNNFLAVVTGREFFFNPFFRRSKNVSKCYKMKLCVLGSVGKNRYPTKSSMKNCPSRDTV